MVIGGDGAPLIADFGLSLQISTTLTYGTARCIYIRASYEQPMYGMYELSMVFDFCN